MPDILVRGLKAQSVKRLKQRAKANGRSLQTEAKLVLEQAAGADTGEITAMFSRWEKQFVGRKFTGSAKLIGEDRAR